MVSVRVRMKKVETLGGVDYFITEDGRVLARGKGDSAEEPELKMWRGYQVMMVPHPGRRGTWRMLYVHKLVAEAFLPNPDKKKYVVHRNGDLTDNRVENLEWSWYPQSVWERRKAGGCGLATDVASMGAEGGRAAAGGCALATDVASTGAEGLRVKS